MQYEVNTQWQLREKLTLHWLEHFAVSYATVGQSADMEHYIETVRADALGNYAKLLADVSKEPAVMIWLDNANNGYLPNTPPNENFGREVMQLYSLVSIRSTPTVRSSRIPTIRASRSRPTARLT